MKKKLSVLLIAAMVLSLAACGSQSGNNGSGNSEPEKTQQEESKPSEEPSKEPSQDANTGDLNNGETMGQSILQDFMARAAAGETDDLEALAGNLLANPSIEFMSGTLPADPGYLGGFSKEIDGFKEGVMFGPMMGSIAFVGYLFRLEDGADVKAFIQNLKDNADPRWQVCVEANETVVDAYENVVFFVMCPGPDEM